jgi:hypothetical protein
MIYVCPFNSKERHLNYFGACFDVFFLLGMDIWGANIEADRLASGLFTSLTKTQMGGKDEFRV